MHEFRIRPPAPFCFEKTAAFLSPGGDDLVDVFDGKRYTRLLDLNGRLRLALVSSLGAEQRPELIVTLMNGTERDEPGVGAALNHLLGFDYELDRFQELCRADQILYGLSRDHHGVKPPLRAHPFEALVLAIASQRPGLHFFRTSVSAIAREHSYKVAYAGDTFYAFPGARLLAKHRPAELALGSVSTKQAEYLHEFATTVSRNEIDLIGWARLPLDELLRRLASIRGIGPLGAELTALIGYGRLDCFPAADPLLRAWVGRNYLGDEDADEKAVARWAEQWDDLRGLVALYIYVDLREEGTL